MQISLDQESPSEFISRVAALLRRTDTHIYFDASILMWLTCISAASRAEFSNWAAALKGKRVHVPTQASHEFYYHCVRETLATEIQARIGKLETFARTTYRYLGPFADEILDTNYPTADAYQSFVRTTFSNLGRLADAASNWKNKYSKRNVREVAILANRWSCHGDSIFASLTTINQIGPIRFSQRIPPGFKDSSKKDSTEEGGNRYGDLVFWHEVLNDASTAKAKSVVILTKDRKIDWYQGGDAITIDDVDLRKIRPRWDPVPSPHPMLSFEARTRGLGDLVLLDAPYLGAVLWQIARKSCTRFAHIAVGVELSLENRANSRGPTLGDPGHPPERQSKRAHNDLTTISTSQIYAALKASSAPPPPVVVEFLQHLDADEPARTEFVEDFKFDSLLKLDDVSRTVFARLLHDRALLGDGASAALAADLVQRLKEIPATCAAQIYLGLLASTYFDGADPRPKPVSPVLGTIFDLQDDPALAPVLTTLRNKLKLARSRALYWPAADKPAVRVIIQHDSAAEGAPLELSGIAVNDVEVLTLEETRPDLNLREILNNQHEASVGQLLQELAKFYGIPREQLTCEADPDELRAIPGTAGFRRADQLPQRAGSRQ